MLKIGFSNKYFTLWDVSSETVYATNPNGQHYPSYEKTNFCFIQNLSFNKDAAIEKAKKMGVKDLEPDEELRGKNGSWDKIEYIPETFEPWQFTFGKHKYQDIRTFEDVEYLHWYYCNANYPEMVANRIMELDSDWVMYKGELMRKEQKKRMQAFAKFDKEMAKNGFCDVVIASSINEHRGMRIENYGEFPVGDSIELKWMYYQGIEYALPVNPKTGKGMRVKGKNARIYSSKKSEQWLRWIIEKIELI